MRYTTDISDPQSVYGHMDGWISVISYKGVGGARRDHSLFIYASSGVFNTKVLHLFKLGVFKSNIDFIS